MKYIPLLELPLLIIMVLIRAMILRKAGVKAFVFGKTDKSDFFIPPLALFFFYAISAGVFDWPFPKVLTKFFFESKLQYLLAITICTVSIIWFALTLTVFGKSFRVGIDTETKDELITKGTFAVSRNPIYVGFMAFFIGIFLAYPNIMSLIFSITICLAMHRQITREEKFLKQHYGKEYADYCKKVRRYI